MNKKNDKIIATHFPFVPKDAIAEVSKTLRSGWLNTGKKEQELREKASKKWNFTYCVATNSCTSALRSALAILGIGSGDEVISTPFTFIATNTVILEQGAKPIFADVNYDDLNINSESIEEKITKKTKAIMIVHYGGNPCDMDEIRKIGKKYSLPIIEDAAQALGSKYKGEFIGSKGDIICFSFQVIKIITSGDGGLITTPSENYYKKLKRVVWFGIDKEGKKTNLLDTLPQNFKGDSLGFKYNMNDITATLASVGVNHYDEAAARRKKIGERYRKELEGVKGIKLLKYYNDRIPNYQLFPIHVANRLTFAEYMNKNNIMIRINNRRNDIYPMFGGIKRDLLNTKRVDEDVALLPIHTGLTDEDISYVISKVKEVVK